MTATRPPDQPGQAERTQRPDDLKQRYLQASADQAIGPSEKVRRAALAHAQAVAAGVHAAALISVPAAANRSRWNVPLVASLAIASISALLALQFDRGDPADKAVVLGTPSVTTPATAPANAPAAAPANAPATAPDSTPAPTSTAPTRLERLPSAAPTAPNTLPAPLPSPLPPPPVPAAPAKAPAPAPAQTAPPRSTEPEKQFKAPAAAVAQSAESAISPSGAAPSAAAPTAATREPPPARAGLPAAKSTAGSGANAPSAAAEKAEASGLADRATAARPAPAIQNKAAPTADAERGAPVAARSESTAAEPSAAGRSRAAAAPISPPATAPAMAAPAPTASPPDAGTALRDAARTGQLGALTQALQTVTAAQLNSTDINGRTALMVATLKGQVEAVQRLVNAGANTELKDAAGQTAVQMARHLGNTQIEAILKSR